ncbi:prosaposin isoform X2 [Hoplias malabaricus]|uniref:prosaposin isoform X2 n=1 Tax=Hoplias malabaricus TaxID=27720 RepID=UPI003461D6F7
MERPMFTTRRERERERMVHAPSEMSGNLKIGWEPLSIMAYSFGSTFLFDTAIRESSSTPTTSPEADNDACQDCLQIIQVLKHLISDGQFQEKLKVTLEGMCDSLPEEFSKICRNQVDKNLALVLAIINSFMIPKDVCVYFQLCDGQLRGQFKDLLKYHMQNIIQFPAVKLNSSIPCALCTYVVDVVECIIPKTATLLTSLSKELCKVFPPIVQSQCTGTVTRVIKTLINVLLDFFSGENVCTVLRLCPGTESSDMMRMSLSDCDSCLTLAVLSRLQLVPDVSELDSSSFLRTVCTSHPDVLPKCESFTQRHGHQLQGLLGKEMTALEMCERADLCEKKDLNETPVSGGNPCSLGSGYSCRNLQTAQECGVVSFCQTSVWN